MTTTDPYDAPLSAVREHVEDLAVALAIWVHRDDTKPQPDVRQAANTAMDAIDAATGQLLRLRTRLTGEIRVSDDACAARVDELLRRAGRLGGEGR
jgi:hypothetical protein